MILKFSEFIKEGLIQSVPIQKVAKILNKKFSNIKIDGNVNDDELYYHSVLTITRKQSETKTAENPEDFKKWSNEPSGMLSIIPKLVPVLDVLGWYISTKIKDDDTFVQKITVEPKFDSLLMFKPDTLYHITDIKNLDRIKKIGLIPKTKSKVLYHPARIYLADGHEIQYLAKGFEHEFDVDPIILKINLIKSKMNLYIDPHCDNAYYTYDNIPPENIIDVLPVEYFTNFEEND